MTLTESFLVVIVIILTIYLLTRGRIQERKSWDCVDRDSGVVTTVQLKYDKPAKTTQSPESDSMAGNTEYYSSQNTNTVDSTDIDTSGSTFQDYIISQAVDPAVSANHKAFVADMTKDNSKNATGATYALGELEGTDQVPWVGIRGRPVAIPLSATAGALQVPDVDPNAFSAKSKFNWTSS